MMGLRGFGVGKAKERKNWFSLGDGYGDGHSNTSGNGYGDGEYQGGDNNENGYGNGHGDPHPANKLSAMSIPEDPYCTRLLADNYHDINFYICQLQLLKGRSP